MITQSKTAFSFGILDPAEQTTSHLAFPHPRFPLPQPSEHHNKTHSMLHGWMLSSCVKGTQA